MQAIMTLEKACHCDVVVFFTCLMFYTQGVATREDIDTTLKLGMGHPMGPLQLG